MNLPQSDAKRTLDRGEQQTLETFHRHVQAFRSGRIREIMADFAEHAVLVTADGALQGRREIRPLYEELLGEFGNIDAGDSPGIIPDVIQVRNDMLFITWHAESRQRIFDFGTDTFLIHDGLIQRQSIAFSTPRARP